MNRTMRSLLCGFGVVALAACSPKLATPAHDVLRIWFSIVGAEPTKKAQMVMMVPHFAIVNMVSPKGASTSLSLRMK